MTVSERFFIEYFVKEENAVFIIRNVEHDDAGEYTITARNSSGVGSSTARLRVRLEPSVDDTPLINPDAFQKLELKKPSGTPEDETQTEAHIKIIEPLQDLNVPEGVQAVFTCKIDASPKAEV